MKADYQSVVNLFNKLDASVTRLEYDWRKYEESFASRDENKRLIFGGRLNGLFNELLNEQDLGKVQARITQYNNFE